MDVPAWSPVIKPTLGNTDYVRYIRHSMHSFKYLSRSRYMSEYIVKRVPSSWASFESTLHLSTIQEWVPGAQIQGWFDIHNIQLQLAYALTSQRRRKSKVGWILHRYLGSNTFTFICVLHPLPNISWLRSRIFFVSYYARATDYFACYTTPCHMRCWQGERCMAFYSSSSSRAPHSYVVLRQHMMYSWIFGTQGI